MENRTTGAVQEETPVAALGLVLIVGGALVAWGVDAFASGFDLQAIGYLMMGGGALALAGAAISGLGGVSAANGRQLPQGGRAGRPGEAR